MKKALPSCPPPLPYNHIGDCLHTAIYHQRFGAMPEFGGMLGQRVWLDLRSDRKKQRMKGDSLLSQGGEQKLRPC
jgi:hypothetical protein